MTTAVKERPIRTRWIAAAASRIRVPVRKYLAALSAGEKICGKCLRSLPKTHEFFGKGKSRCRKCVSDQQKLHYYANRAQERARQLKYQRENREKLYAYNAGWQRRYRARLRSEMIAAFGGKCECCGEAQRMFLDLDHVKGNGRQKRAECGGNDLAELNTLKKLGWPRQGYQLLCCNCHQGRHRNGGICPHKTNAL